MHSMQLTKGRGDVVSKMKSGIGGTRYTVTRQNSFGPITYGRDDWQNFRTE
jgi:hypothetical protein